LSLAPHTSTTTMNNTMNRPPSAELSRVKFKLQDDAIVNSSRKFVILTPPPVMIYVKNHDLPRTTHELTNHVKCDATGNVFRKKCGTIFNDLTNLYQHAVDVTGTKGAPHRKHHERLVDAIEPNMCHIQMGDGFWSDGCLVTHP
jgi:hypothetical protein